MATPTTKPAATAPETETFLRQHRAEIERAAQSIAPYTRRTPTLTTDLDPGLLLKPECFQVTGSFKARGAFNAILNLKRHATDAASIRGVIAVSSGNHAQALALAAKTAGIPALVLIPEDANPQKVAATKAYGAEVRQEGITFANREQRLVEVMEETGYTLVHPFDNWDIIHGAGTAALELVNNKDQAPQTIVTPCGGGGLLTGTALAAKSTDPEIKVYGVEPELADDAARTYATGTLQTLPTSPDTLADGVRTTHIGQKNFEVIVERRLVDGIVTVSEEEIKEATRQSWTRLKLALEPTGALPLAAYLAGKIPAAQPDQPTALILSGGNANLSVIAELLTSRA